MSLKWFSNLKNAAAVAMVGVCGIPLAAQYSGPQDPGYAPQYQYQAQNQGTNQYPGPNQYADPSYQNQNQPDLEDQPGRSVARISVMNGEVSVRRADAGDVVAAAVNAPLMVQDNLVTGPGARAEVEFDYAHRARLGPDAELRISNLEPGHYQLQLARGFLTYSLVRNSQAQAEIDTPSASVRPLGRGQVRVWVREDGETTVTVRSGEVEINTPRGAERLRGGQSILLRGNPQDPEYQVIAAQGGDQWDGWNDERDRQLERSQAYNYVSSDIVGADDLDSYGRWDSDPQYGRVWVPQVAADWAPYQDGRWAWEDYYGWTWVGNEPWGWAPYHYGNWYRGSLGWAWYPGPRYGHTWYRPALVGFFGFGGGGGFDFGFGFGNVGWCALAPYERYHPWYGRGGFRGYDGGRGFGRNLTIVNNTNITNIYRNARYGAVSASSQQFLNGGARYSRVNGAQLQNAALVRGQLPFTPTNNALRFSDRQASAMPRTNFANSRFFSRSPVNQQSAARVPFQQQQQIVQQSARTYAQSGGRTFGTANNGSGYVRQNGQAIYRNGGIPAQAGQSYGTAGSGVRQAQPYSNPGVTAAPYSRQPVPSAQQNSNWSRFGQPSRTANQAVVPNAGYRAPAQTQQQGGWNRFGGTQQQAPYRQAAPQSYSGPGYSNPSYPNQGYRTAPSNQNYARPQTSAPYAGQSYGQQRSLQLSQPVVRPREMYRAPQQSYNPPSYNRAPQSYSAPAYRPSPSYSAPASRPAPSYSAPRQAPSRSSGSAPRPSGGGGRSSDTSHDRHR